MLSVSTKNRDPLKEGLEAVLSVVDSKKRSIKSRSQLAKALGIKRQAINGWSKVPAERVLEIEDLLNVPAWRMRPDLYRRPKK